MSKEAPVILLINSPQNSKTSELPKIDLLDGNFTYRRIVSAFDEALDASPADSLSFGRQYASVVHSVASFGAFTDGLRQTQYPGAIDPPVDFKFMGHSVGEMASFIEAGVLDIPTVAQILFQRQFITERPVEAGIKFMLAAVGLDISRYEAFLAKIKEQFQGKVEATIANFNSPSEGVLSVKIADDAEEKDVKSLAAKLTSSLGEFKHPLAEGLRVVRLPIANAFHSSFMRAEEGLFVGQVGSSVREQTRRVIHGTVYSPMMPGWVKTRKQAVDIILHQLTRPVNFAQGMEDILQIPNLVAIVTADVKDITPGMVLNNLEDKARIPILNIKDNMTLQKAVDECRKLCRG